MRAATLAVLAGLVAGLPAASAADCVSGVAELCDAAESARLDGVFGEYADVALVVLGLVSLALVLSLLVWVLSGGNRAPKFAVEPRDQVKEVGPGGTVQLLMDVENLRRAAGLDLWVNVGELPVGWEASPFAAVSTASGFTFPVAIGREAPLHLSAPSRGAHKAAVAVQLMAPPDPAAEETLDLPVRLVPLAVGVPRSRKGKELRYSVLLTLRRPHVEIRSVVHDPERIAAGRPVNTRATVTNSGELEARDVAVSFLLNEQAVDQKVVPVLPVQGEATVEFSWVAAHGENRIRISLA